MSVKPVPGLPPGTEITNAAEIQFEIFDPLVTPEVVNIIDTTKPNCVVDPLPAVTSTEELTVTWTGTDDIGEIDAYAVFVRTNDGGWAPFLAETSETSAQFAGEEGSTYEFLCAARDTAGNVEEASTVAEARTTVSVQADLEVGKTAEPDPVEWGAYITYTIEAMNHGPATVEAVALEDSLPKGVSVRSVNASQGDCEAERFSVACDLGALDPGQSATVTVVVRPRRPGSIRNVVEVASETPDDVLSNNMDMITTTVLRK